VDLETLAFNNYYRCKEHENFQQFLVRHHSSIPSQFCLLGDHLSLYRKTL